MSSIINTVANEYIFSESWSWYGALVWMCLCPAWMEINSASNAAQRLTIIHQTVRSQSGGVMRKKTYLKRILMFYPAVCVQLKYIIRYRTAGLVSAPFCLAAVIREFQRFILRFWKPGVTPIEAILASWVT